ncbi:MAG: alpha/beta family hydrolase, partial [Phenylobacterium sp.]
PLLFLQGSNDEFAELELLQATVAGQGARAQLKLVDAADHSFHVPAKSGRKDAEVMAEFLDAARDWMAAVTATPRGPR